LRFTRGRCTNGSGAAVAVIVGENKQMLTFHRTESGYRVEGNINESADFSALPDAPLELDLSRVRRINSTGIRNWLRWMDELSHPLVLREVPCNVVVELSLIPRLSKNVSVRSVRAPYYNPETGETEHLLIDSKMLDWIRKHKQVPKMQAEGSGCELEFDEDENNYFGFLFTGSQPGAEPGAEPGAQQ
jgi:hypothetical protein